MIGFGAIGQAVARLIRHDDELSLAGVLVRDRRRRRPSSCPPTVWTVQELVGLSADVTIEAAGAEALAAYAPEVLRTGSDLVMVSVGALADPAVLDSVSAAAREGGSRAIVASGAIGALDVLAAAAVGGLSKVVYTTRKSPDALLPREELPLSEPRVVFRGPADEAVRRWPQQLNVAAAVALAGAGFAMTEVNITADPSVAFSEHEINAYGAFGHCTFTITLERDEIHHRSSRLIAMSVVHALHRRHATIVLG
jgi:aspartate dehydrogenase